MTVYFCVLVALGFIFLIRMSNLAPTNRIKNFLFALAWIILILVAGLRYQVGTDYAQYSRNYAVYLGREVDLLNQPALTVVAWIARFIRDDYATWFFLMALVTFIPVAYVVKKESIALGLSTVFFVLLGCWHTSFNIVKQSAAMAVIFLGYRYLLDRKLLKWCFVCVLGALFHVTALMMIPVYFLIAPKISWGRSFLLVIVGVAIAMLYEELFGVMGLLRGVMTESVSSSVGAEELNILRVLVNCAPVLLATVLLKYYNRKDVRFSTLYNASFFNSVLNVATMGSAYLNRFAIYTSVFNVLFIPYLLKPFKRNLRILIWTVMLVLYGVFWAYDLYKCSDTVQFYWIFQR